MNCYRTLLASDNSPEPTLTSQSGYVVYATLILTTVIGVYFAVLIIANRGAVVPMKLRVNKLQAEVNAWSGLSLAQAFVAGYDRQGPTWETERLVRDLGVGESVAIRAVRTAGWLDVDATGIFRKDTCRARGRLGQSPPEVFACALALGNSAAQVDIADRARVVGDIATTGGQVGTIRSGRFAGRRVPFDDPVFSDTALERELDIVVNRFRERAVPAVSRRGTWDRDTASPAAGGSIAALWIDSTVVLREDMNNKNLRVQGKVVIGGQACLRDICIRATGDITVSDSARVEHSTIVSLAGVHITGNSVVRADIIAAETLLIDGLATVQYPSFLYLSSCMARHGGSGNSVLLVGGKAVVEGTVATASFGEGSFPKMVLSTRGVVRGLLTSPHAVTPFCRIEGSLNAPVIEYRRGHEVFRNQLFDTHLEYHDLAGMVIPLLFARGVPRYLTWGRAQ